MNKKLHFFSLLFLLLGLSLLSYLVIDIYLSLFRPVSEHSQQIIFSIEEGEPFSRISSNLKESGLITNEDSFRLLGQFTHSISKIKAGDYSLDSSWSPMQILKTLVAGKTILYKLTLPEGLSWWETAKSIEKQGFARYEDLKELFFDKEFLASQFIYADSIEGFLYPETYFLRKPKSANKEQAKKLVELLVRTFWQKNKLYWEHFKRPELIETTNSMLAESPKDIDFIKFRELLTLASLVEKETSIPNERSVVAGVYANRLARSMLLQADPTIPYGIGESFQGPITRSQIQDKTNKYNTYQHPLLPPGPICSVGDAALRAAFAPEKHDFLYFVATGLDGGHVFSKNLDEHNNAVKKYRNIIRMRKKVNE